MRTSFENSKAIKFKVDVEVSDAVINEIVKRLELSLFAGVGGFHDYPHYSNLLAGWPTIEQLRDTEVDACVDSLRKNILFRISEFLEQAKQQTLKKQRRCLSFIEKWTIIHQPNPKYQEGEGNAQKTNGGVIQKKLTCFITC